MINLEVFEFFYRIINGFIKCYNIDFFGLGFTWLQFILSVALIGIVLTFLFQGFNIMDKFNFKFMFYNDRFANAKKMPNDNREQQLTYANDFYRSHGYPPSGFIDVWGDGTDIRRIDD